MTEFRYETRVDGTVVITPGEYFDQYTAPALRDIANARLRGEGQRVVIDLTSTSAIDSVGVGVLVGVYRTLAEHSGSLAVACAEGDVLRTLRRMALVSVLGVYGSVEEALRMMAAQVAS